MKTIYVDYSKKEMRTINGKKQLMKKKDMTGGIGVVIVENGKITLAEKVMCKGINEGEKLAFLYGMKYLSNGDIICTDQNSIPLQLSMFGQLESKSRNKITQHLNQRINNVLSLKKGVTIQEVGSHKGDEYHNLADRLSKIASGVRGNSMKKLIDEQGIVMTKSKLKNSLIKLLDS
ncbi:ribonuclease H-like domain protein [Vibrio phage 1.084.O._10N.261.49.F5]|nr:ribonuclease H-like domain protein [Vibrio phage 1.084.O._10N.261.49.F5]